MEEFSDVCINQNMWLEVPEKYGDWFGMKADERITIQRLISELSEDAIKDHFSKTFNIEMPMEILRDYLICELIVLQHYLKMFKDRVEEISQSYKNALAECCRSDEYLMTVELYKEDPESKHYFNSLWLAQMTVMIKTLNGFKDVWEDPYFRDFQRAYLEPVIPCTDMY